MGVRVLERSYCPGKQIHSRLLLAGLHLAVYQRAIVRPEGRSHELNAHEIIGESSSGPNGNLHSFHCLECRSVEFPSIECHPYFACELTRPLLKVLWVMTGGAENTRCTIESSGSIVYEQPVRVDVSMNDIWPVTGQDQ